jgi:hypothetical protein
VGAKATIMINSSHTISGQQIKEKKKLNGDL